jgi:hypothetical protein
MSDQRTNHNDARGDAARLLHAAARERLKVVMTDLFLPAHLRLTEWQRTAMSALLERLVQSVEAELRASLAGHFPSETHADANRALAGGQGPVAQSILEDTGALRDPVLVALLLRRVEEHRLRRNNNHGTPAAPEGLFGELVHDAEEAVGEAAMAVLIAQSRRLDRFQEPLLPSHELPAEVQHRLVWSIAAALRTYLVERHAVLPDEADDALAAAANQCLSAHDEGEGLEARCLRLMSILEERGRLDGAFLVRAMSEGGLTLLLASLSLRCGLLPDAVWELAFEPLGRGLPLLLRATGLERAEVGEILVAIHGNVGADDDALLVRQLDLFDTTSLDEARRTLRLWRADPLYRTAAEAPAP